MLGFRPLATNPVDDESSSASSTPGTAQPNEVRRLRGAASFVLQGAVYTTRIRGLASRVPNALIG